ncbi:hypothetical protein [Intestinimonas butyriciproducens]|uniref:hypothetical protein n=1 Tax=Intestinimonas butyriciproducens TaxID=1297617 RepID=UPI001955F6D5|nr:hypothetical protein [Intestinimonas butyriciproducens]MBM6977804.1 hypothetical protein [Intestinimonas butyriciproducens]
MLNQFVLCLALTLAVELPVALLWGVRGRDLLLCALANVLTNPPVVLLHLIFPDPRLLLLLECAAVGSEGLVYLLCARDLRAPFLFSLCANGCSFGLGLVIGGIL